MKKKIKEITQKYLFALIMLCLCILSLIIGAEFSMAEMEPRAVCSNIVAILFGMLSFGGFVFGSLEDN